MVELKASSSDEDARQWWGEILGIKPKMKRIYLAKIDLRENLGIML